MKRLALLLLLLPLASSALFAQIIGNPGSIIGTLLSGTVGVPYSATLTTSPQSFAAWSYTGSLPPGLNMTTGSSYAATISGTPTVAGTYTFTVQANLGTNPNAAPIVVTQTYTVPIAGPPVYIIPSSVPNGTFGATYLQVLTASGGYGAGTYTFSLDAAGGPLPPGLVLSPTGLISGTPVTLGTFSFIVRAASQTASGASVSGSQSYSITIAAAPPAIATTSLPAGTVGVLYSQNLAATGGSPPYTWQQTGGSLPGGVTLSSSGNLYGTPTAAGSSTFQVKVTDSQQGTATGSFTIRIVPAALVITTTSLPAGTVGTSYTATLAATGGIPPYTWSVAPGSTLPAGLSISSAGVISGTPAASGTFSVTLQVADSAQLTATKAYSVTVAAAPVPLSITTTQASLPNPEVGVAYTQAFAATGGTPPYQWSVSTGTLPTGFTLSSAGILAGTPTAAVTFSFTLQVTDSAKATATKAFTIIAINAVKVMTPPPLDGVTGVSYTMQFGAGGGLGPYTWSIASGSIPGGLSLNTATGLLSGTPTTPGTYTFIIGVTDQNGQKDSVSYSIKIVAALSITTQGPLPGGVVGVAYAQTLAATGGTAPYRWLVSFDFPPPAWLTLSAAGSLTGTPTAAGTFNFTLQVVDDAGRNTTASFTITVTAALTITTTTLPNAIVGTPYSQTLALAGGSGTLTWSISTGALPGGITLNSSTGSLSGTPSTAGASTFTVSVTGGGQTATKSFTITVTAALTITTATLPNGTVGTPYSQTLAAAGGNGTLTWSVSTGALPGGIALDSSAGSLSGTPSAPGAFPFTVSVTGGGQTATKSLTITVGVPPGPSVTITGLPATATPATQPALGISIPSAYPLAITGTVTLTFAPDSPSPDGQEVVFTTGGRTVGFTVAANTTQVAFSGATPGVQIGTVSGTITLTLKLTAAGLDVTPSPAPSTKLTIAKSAPVINPQGVTVTRTTGGFNLVVKGYATSREMVSAAVTFTAATGVTLASSQATIQLGPIFTTWYADPTSAAYGSNFLLTMPFTIANGTSTAPLTSVSVVLTNAQGNSNSMSATY